MKKVGIQGGRGSFNHQGWMEYARKNNLNDWEIVFLHTTKNVLTALENNEIHKGQFAIYNTLAGLVEETAAELGKYKFNIADWYKFPIAHFLMKKMGVKNEEITKIMAHPQGFKQCKNLEKITNTGDRIDHAKIAEDLANGKLDSNIAVIGPKMLSDIYDLEIMAENLQDSTENFTTMVLVE